MGKAVGVTSLEGYSIAGEIILGLEAVCLQLSLIYHAYMLMACVEEDLLRRRPFWGHKSESALLPETITFSSCTQ